MKKSSENSLVQNFRRPKNDNYSSNSKNEKTGQGFLTSERRLVFTK